VNGATVVLLQRCGSCDYRTLSDTMGMDADSLVVNPGRLRILTALAASEREEFVPLRNRTRLTDGNLAAHAKRLHSAGLIEIDKQFRDGKPVTSFTLTRTGRAALESHARELLAAVGISPRPALATPLTSIAQPTHDWID
jgi:DNA-binding MarR family transcriptional regulator